MITPAPDYAALSDRLVRVETKLDMVIDRLDGSHDDHEDRIRALEQRPNPAVIAVDHESRLRRLERAVWVASGVALVGGGLVGGVVGPLLGG
ncbi:hypothetical protein ACFQE5_23095 [Pseudonocardia hispaniensis]|uniref:DUF3618 domain-containing protein n=1 Tax=Pseudonocardia hispaniensis TaxID=904933 RepID=A0ABW1J881_9PSEU